MGNGENLGVMSTADALKLARENELDLVLISEQANPPVAKILEYGWSKIYSVSIPSL